MKPVTDWSKYKNFDPKTDKMLTCPCGCNTLYISETLMDIVQKAREIAGIPFTVTSGCRCPKYNPNISTSKNSDHLSDKNTMCYALDIHTPNDRTRFIVTKAAMLAGADRVKPYYSKDCVHIGISRDLGGRNDPNVMWKD